MIIHASPRTVKSQNPSFPRLSILRPFSIWEFHQFPSSFGIHKGEAIAIPAGQLGHVWFPGTNSRRKHLFISNINISAVFKKHFKSTPGL
jgi:hypothetical protein